MAKLQDGVLTVKVWGTVHSIIETAEQIGWLVAAIRSSPYETGLACCYPFIQDFQAAPGPGLKAFNFNIGVALSVLDRQSESENGHCWRQAFNNLIAVRGYPILRRGELEGAKGLEMSLDILLALVDASTVTTFNGKPVIKGFSAILVPTMQVDDTIVWHLLCNEDGSRISYLDRRLHGLRHINPTEISISRHVLGWCSRAETHTGKTTPNGARPCCIRVLIVSSRITRGELQHQVVWAWKAS